VLVGWAEEAQQTHPSQINASCGCWESYWRAGIGNGISFPLCTAVFSVVQAFDCQPQRTRSYTEETQGKSKSLQLSANSTARPEGGAAAAPGGR
jgi:hypothetical protein